MTPDVLHDYLQRTAAARPQHPAVEEAGGDCVAYGELLALAERLRDRLQALGVQPGDRVGICIHKSIDSVAAIWGVLLTGAAYVPVDPTAPPSRNAYVFTHCAVRAIVAEERLAAALQPELAGLDPAPALVALPPAGGGRALGWALDELDARRGTAPAGRTLRPAPDDLAYILYTSGSTGRPKGVMLSHRNATSFVDWCSEALQPGPGDRFSAHAPFHFDLSIFDLYVPVKHGGTLVVIGEELGKDPVHLARFIAAARLSVWYSAPSILSLLVQRGELERHDYGALRTVLFAGEVFPVVHLRALKHRWPLPRFFNLYGPTETNVCTWYEIPPEVPAERTEPYPIGKVCSHLEGLVVDAQARPVPASGEGELCIAGAGVMRGYWGDAAQTAERFLQHGGKDWYRTGDIVTLDAAGDFRFLGRRDRMVKKRGYRVELGEIEACLTRHAGVFEAAVVASPHDELGLLVRAHLGTDGGKRLSAVQLKQFCAQVLPTYMIPDQFAFHAQLPKTSTGKMDYQALAGWTPPQP